MESSKRDLNLVLESLVATLTNVRSKLFYKIIIETSCKISELANIKIEDLSEDGIKFAERSVPISHELNKLVIQYIEEEKLSSKSFLFSTRQSGKISPKRIRQIIQAISEEKFGFKIDPKDIRHYSIKKKLRTEDVKKVKQEAGLKRLDKRKYLSGEQVKKLELQIKDKRTSLIFQLLLHNFKSSQIINFKVEDILRLNVPIVLIHSLENYASSNRVSFGDYLFRTRQNTHLSKVRVYKIITNLGKKVDFEVTPQIINNTAIAKAVFSSNSESKLNELGIKTRAFHLHGGFIKNE